jgi:hypothetical protein
MFYASGASKYGMIGSAQEKVKVAAMLKGRIRSVLVAILLLTYVGQALFAASLTCKSMAPQPAQLGQAEPTGGCPGHSEPTADDSANGTNPSDSCPHCDCYLGGCSAIPLALASQAVSQTGVSVLVDGYLASTSNHQNPSLFRPPITT